MPKEFPCKVSTKIRKAQARSFESGCGIGQCIPVCKMMGFSRDTFYWYQKAKETGGVEALLDKSRSKPNLKNRVDEVTEKAVTDFAIEYPAYGQVRVSNELRKKGIFVSPSGVRSIWLRHGLESMKLRLFALEKKSAEEGLILTEAQVQALAKKKQDDEASGENDNIQLTKISQNCRASRLAKTAPKVSWRGMPFLTGKNFFKKSILALPNPSISTKLSAPQIAAHKATRIISRKGYKAFAIYLGSLRSPKKRKMEMQIKSCMAILRL